MTRESSALATWKAMRQGTLALMTPVMTSARGVCVAMIMWMPAARAFCVMRAMAHLDVGGRGLHEVGELVDDDDDVGHPVGDDEVVFAGVARGRGHARDALFAGGRVVFGLGDLEDFFVAHGVEIDGLLDFGLDDDGGFGRGRKRGGGGFLEQVVGFGLLALGVEFLLRLRLWAGR